MSFVDAFYSFRIDLNNSNEEVYTKVNLKLAKHPDESIEFLLSRLIAFLFVYSEGLQFSRGLFEVKDPVFYKINEIEEITQIGEVGVPDKKKLQHAIKRNPKAKVSLFFLNQEEINKFCHYLKGSTENWVDKINFYQVISKKLDYFIENLNSSNNLVVNIFENEIFIMDKDDRDYKFEINHINIWDKYQKVIENL